MVAPWQETQYRVVIEFKKGGSGARRSVKLTHSAEQPQLPQQLYGRVDPQAWALLMTDLGQLALSHPWMQAPTADYCCGWLAAAMMALVVGFGCFPGEDYGPWLQQLHAVLERHRPAFAHGGCALSVQHVHGSFWVQVDVDPHAVAVGAPVAQPGYYGPGAPSQPGQPGSYPPQYDAQPYPAKAP